MSNLKDMYKTVVKDDFPEDLTITMGDNVLSFKRRAWDFDGEVKGLRYGENPDQPAALYRLESGAPIVQDKKWRGAGDSIISDLREEQILQAGKHPGKTNLTDVDNGINILQYLTDRASAVILKHNNPCGAAWSKESIDDALSKAFWCDRIAAFGGAVIVNRPLNMEAAKLIADNYFEVVAAPSFEAGTLELLATRKNLRIMQISALAELEKIAYQPFLDIKSLSDGGLIIQQSFVNRIRTVEDFLPAAATDKNGTSVNARVPSKEEADDLLFAWAVEAGVTSNSVIFAKDGATVAIGTGEQDRVGCVELAIYKAYTKYADKLCFKKENMPLYDLQQKALSDEAAAKSLAEINEQTRNDKGGLKGTVMVSDGFFPFRDGVDVAVAQGVVAIAQPGGSMRDVEVIMATNEQSPQVAMVFTGQRSFKH